MISAAHPCGHHGSMSKSAITLFTTGRQSSRHSCEHYNRIKTRIRMSPLISYSNLIVSFGKCKKKKKKTCCDQQLEWSVVTSIALGAASVFVLDVSWYRCAASAGLGRLPQRASNQPGFRLFLTCKLCLSSFLTNAPRCPVTLSPALGNVDRLLPLDAPPEQHAKKRRDH